VKVADNSALVVFQVAVVMFSGCQSRYASSAYRDAARTCPRERERNDAVTADA
jgi:hypothetical protein